MGNGVVARVRRSSPQNILPGCSDLCEPVDRGTDPHVLIGSAIGRMRGKTGKNKKSVNFDRFLRSITCIGLYLCTKMPGPEPTRVPLSSRSVCDNLSSWAVCSNLSPRILPQCEKGVNWHPSPFGLFDDPERSEKRSH